MAQKRGLRIIELGRDLDEKMHMQVAPCGAAQPCRPLAAQEKHLAGLGARSDVEDLLAIEGVEGDGGSESRGGHWERHGAVEFVALPLEYWVGCDGDLDIKIAGWSAVRADLALAGELDAGAGVDAGRDLDGEGAPGSDPTVARALGAGVLDGLAKALTLRAGSSGHDLAEE